MSPKPLTVRQVKRASIEFRSAFYGRDRSPNDRLIATALWAVQWAESLLLTADAGASTETERTA